MQQANVYRYSKRAEIDTQIAAMRDRIVEERRGQIGRMAARDEAIAVTTVWYRKQYEAIERELED